RAGNGSGGAGACWRCSVMPVRVLDASGAGRSSDVAMGIRWAADHGADVVNLSLSGATPSAAVEPAVAHARPRGALVVGAAGNQTRAGQDLTAPQFPADVAGVIGVVATDPADAAYPWSFRGAWAEVAAPGCNLAPAPGGRYEASFCGTSSAAPLVSGL